MFEYRASKKAANALKDPFESVLQPFQLRMSSEIGNWNAHPQDEEVIQVTAERILEGWLLLQVAGIQESC